MSDEQREPIVGDHDWSEKRALVCAGWFDGKFNPENYRRCAKAAVIVFEVADPRICDVPGVPGKQFRMKNAFTGACEEHEAQRRQLYQLVSSWSIVREFPARDARLG